MQPDPNDPRFHGLVRAKACQVQRQARLHAQDLPDLEQALFAAALTKLRRYDHARSYLGAYLARALDFAASNLLRDLLALKRNPHRARSLDALGTGKESAADSEMALRGHFGRLAQPVPRDQDNVDRRLDVHAVLASLRSELRDVAEDLMGGLTPTEIARKRGVARGTVYQRMNRLRQHLARLAI